MKSIASFHTGLFPVGQSCGRRGFWFVLAMCLLQSWTVIRGGSAAEITEIYGFVNEYNPSSLVQSANGDFYGTVSGASDCGRVFQLKSNGALVSLAAFNGANGCPFEGGPLVQGPDGNYYGTTRSGGTNVLNRPGTIFQVTANGTLTSLVCFNGTNGAYPESGLVLGTGGDFYGATAYGGPSYQQSMGTPLRVPGTIFKMTMSGVITTLASFNRTNGASPSGRLLLGIDGNFYGTTVAGGPNEAGTVFQMKPDGALTTLLLFNGTNGANPYGGLVQGTDGNLYGAASHGGANGCGTVFRIKPDATLTTLFSFNGTNGAYPFAGLIQGSDGILYGSTLSGGSGYDGSLNSGYGTLFGITTNGVLVSLGLFNGTNGAHPVTGLVQGSDVNLYGTTAGGGSHGAGNIYRVELPIVAQIRAQAGNVFALTWNAVSGRSYQAQHKSGCSQTNWSNLGASITATNRTATALDYDGAQAQQFYRVIQLP